LDTYGHLPKCITCAAVAKLVMEGIIRDLRTELEREFPDLKVTFV